MSTHVVVMGVSGSGKSTVGELLAAGLGIGFVDADSLHPESNVAKMASGSPLDDADRAPWLAAVAASFTPDVPLVIACSALKRSYRDLIRDGAPEVVFVHLHGTTEVLAGRLGGRSDHFMPPALLESQLQALQPLEPDERGFVLDLANDPAELVRQAMSHTLV